jgi:hypothetical protein
MKTKSYLASLAIIGLCASLNAQGIWKVYDQSELGTMMG